MSAFRFDAVLGVALSLLAPRSPFANPSDARTIRADETSVGILLYFAPPDVSICFCGSFRLEPERGFPAYYLAADVDLSPYIGQKIEVTGEPFLKPCTGTLLQECPYLKVAHVEPANLTSTDEATWGRIKALYR